MHFFHTAFFCWDHSNSVSLIKVVIVDNSSKNLVHWDLLIRLRYPPIQRGSNKDSFLIFSRDHCRELMPVLFNESPWPIGYCARYSISFDCSSLRFMTSRANFYSTQSVLVPNKMLSPYKKTLMVMVIQSPIKVVLLNSTSKILWSSCKLSKIDLYHLFHDCETPCLQNHYL